MICFVTLQELFVNECYWAKGNYAKNKNGANVGLFDESGSCWCLLGAIHKCYNRRGEEIVAEIIAKIKIHLKGMGFVGSISSFNDSPETKFEDILKIVQELGV